MLVLDGNIPRFPWEPSTTMLTYRLAGTTEASVSNRGRPHHSANPTHQPASPVHHRRETPTSSLATASPKGALLC